MAHNEPPGLPDVVDEAGDTPSWVPILGLCLLALAALTITVTRATGGDEGEAKEQAADEGAE